MPANAVLELAYAAVCTRLAQQDSTLSGLRNRATGITAAASVGSSVGLGLGLFDVRRPGGLPQWAGWTNLGLSVCVAVSVVVILWPVSGWTYGPNAGRLLQARSLDVDDVHRLATQALLVDEATNERTLTRRFHAFQLSAGLLMVQTALLVAAVVLR